jgi:hypothetical protein
MSSGLIIHAEEAKGDKNMSRKKKHVVGDCEIFLDGENVDGIFKIDNLLQGQTRNRGYDIRDVEKEQGRDEELFGYTDDVSKVLGACADEYIKLKANEAKIAQLGRIITAPVSIASSYADLLSELRFARSEAEIDTILEKYGIGTATEELPAAKEFARIMSKASNG